MTPRFETVEEIFHAALDCEPDQLVAFLDKRCAGDELLRGKVEQLLAAHRQAGSFIATPVATLDTSIVENEQPDLLIGQTIGHYKILKRIGAGGMGEVYVAFDVRAGRKAALKVLPTRFTDDAGRLKRFQQEARAVAGLNHPNVLTVYEIGEIQSTHYIASELIDGETLRQRLCRGRLEVDEAVDVAIQVAGALSAAHSAGVVHRDVKPENIMLRPDGYVKVLDFGIAKLAEQELPVTVPEEEALLLVETNLGSVLGTVRYMSPEQTRGASVDKRTDIWSLGVVLFEMLTGRAPFNGDTPVAIMAAILAKEPPLLANYMRQASGALQQIVSKALQKDAAQRYQNANEMLGALKTLRRQLEFRAELERSAPTGLWFRWTRSPTVLVFALLVGALFFAFPFYWLRKPIMSSPPEKSVAVLPFQNLSKDQEKAFFTDGIQEEILSRLSKIADLKVISRTSTQRYKSKPENLPTIAKQLGVTHILEGSVQESGDAMRINVQLINAQSDSHLWAENYDRKVTDIFAVESEIATKIADTLQAKLTGREQRAIAARPTENTEAYQLYLQGRHLWGQRTDTGLLKAIDYFNRALSLDPNYARAYAGIADCYITLPAFSKLNPAECRQKAKLAASRALEIDSDLADAHVSLGVLLMNDGKVAEARNEFLRAMQFDPNYANAPHWYALKVLVPLGQFDEAIAQLKRALELDPLSPPFNANLGMGYTMARRYPEAIAQLRKTVELNPAFSYGYGVLGYALDASGQFDQAIPEMEKAYELSRDFHVLGLLGHAYALRGDREKAFQLLKQLQDLEQQSSDWNYGLALIYLALGDKNEALNRLEESYRTGEVGFNLLEHQSRSPGGSAARRSAI